MSNTLPKNSMMERINLINWRSNIMTDFAKLRYLTYSALSMQYNKKDSLFDFLILM